MKHLNSRLLFSRYSSIRNALNKKAFINNLYPLQNNIINKSFCSSNVKMKLKFTDLRNITLELPDTSNLKDLENEIKKHKNFEYIEFRTWDNSKISSHSSLDSILIKSNEPIFVKIDKFEWQELKRKDVLNINNVFNIANRNEEETSFEAKNRIINNLKKISKNKDLSDKDYEDIEEDLTRLRHFYHNSIENKIISEEDMSNISTNINGNINITNIFERYFSLKEEYSKLISLENSYIKSSERKALFIILLGGILFILELLALYYGTFVYYSWDITEPITYLVTCGNLLLILLFKRKFGSKTAHEYFASLFLKRKLKKQSFDKLNMLKIQNEIKDIQRKLN